MSTISSIDDLNVNLPIVIFRIASCQKLMKRLNPILPTIYCNVALKESKSITMLFYSQTLQQGSQTQIVPRAK